MHQTFSKGGELRLSVNLDTTTANKWIRRPKIVAETSKDEVEDEKGLPQTAPRETVASLSKKLDELMAIVTRLASLQGGC